MSSKKATYFSIAKFTLLMNHDSLRQYLYDHIPLTKAMQVDITAVSDSSLTLTAPLTPNINHRETVFGGSASALCILSAWSYIHCRLKNYPQFSPRIVIQENSMKYTKPVLDQFVSGFKFPSFPNYQFRPICTGYVKNIRPTSV